MSTAVLSNKSTARGEIVRLQFEDLCQGANKHTGAVYRETDRQGVNLRRAG